MIVAVDGPSASGKSTVARGVSGALGLPYLDTGSLYRAVTWAVLDRGVDPHDADACVAVAESVIISILGPGMVAVDGHDVSHEIRQVAVNADVSAVSRHPGVRRHLLGFQRDFPGPEGAVVEGRDIGTVVFPDAEVKVFLTADPQERARRRDREAGGGAGSDLARRDTLDHNTTPLDPAPDAVMIDTTGRDASEIVDHVVRLTHEAGRP